MRVLITLAAMAISSLGALAQTAISTTQAHQMTQAGQMVLVDIRTPAEWAQTGVPEGALSINVYDPDFLTQLVDALDGDLSQPVGFICAVGGRSGNLTRYLAEQGLPNIYDVQGGMNGRGQHTGWADAGLPTVAAVSEQ